MRGENEIRAEYERLDRLVHDPATEQNYDDWSFASICARWNALKWVLGVE